MLANSATTLLPQSGHLGRAESRIKPRFFGCHFSARCAEVSETYDLVATLARAWADVVRFLNPRMTLRVSPHGLASVATVYAASPPWKKSITGFAQQVGRVLAGSHQCALVESFLFATL